MKIIDAFIFSNEIDILKGRLEYLYDVVDYFVMVESDITFSGYKRELVFPKILHEIKPYQNKILYFPTTLDLTQELQHKIDNKFLGFDYSNPKYNSSSWIREELIRNHILISLNLFDINDVLMISDVDEIPKKDSILEAINKLNFENHISLIQDIIYYNLDYKELIQCYGTVITTINFTKILNSIEILRRQRFGMTIIENSGWHLTSWVSPKGIKEKIKNCSHQELNTEEFNNPHNFLINMKNHESIFGTKLININSDYYPEDFYNIFLKYSKNYVTIED